MNTKGNQRTVQTENKVKGVFLDLLKEKDISRISVSEICQKAQIHRTTFYTHYKDVADLMEKLVQEMYEQIMGFFVQEGQPLKNEGFLHLFEMIREHREFFSVYLSAVGDVSLVYERLPEELKNRVDEILSVMGFVSREELLYHQTFFCEGLSAVIRRWIRGGCAESPEEMCRIIEKEYMPNRRLFLGEKESDF